MMYTLTTWSKGGYRRYEALCVSWPDVANVLGHDHEGSPEDDAVLLAALRTNGAPHWIADADGAIDETGWYLIGPEIGDVA